MSFHDARFPTSIDFGSSGGPSWSTGRVELDGGGVEMVSRWSSPLYVFEALNAVKDPQQVADLLRHYNARRGPANSFPFKDWSDYATTPDGRTTASGGGYSVTGTDQQVGTGDGTTKTFQLVKRYADGGFTTVRNITLPITATVLVSFNPGGAQASGWTVSRPGGVLTFTSAPGIGVLVTAGFEFDVPVRYGQEIDAAGLRATIAGLKGAQVERVPLVEDRTGEVCYDDVYRGDSADVTYGANFTVDVYHAVQTVTASTTGLIGTFPDASSLPTGRWLTLFNVGSNNIVYKRSDGTTEFTLNSNSAADVCLVDQGGVRRWRAL